MINKNIDYIEQMSWEEEEFSTNHPNYSAPMIPPGTAKNNIKALANVFPNGRIVTRNPVTGKKTELIENAEREILKYLSPVRITPVTSNPKNLSKYINFKKGIENMKKTRSSKEFMKKYWADQAVQNELNRPRREQEEERLRIFQQEMARRQNEINEGIENNSNNNSVVNYERYNPYLNGGKRSKKTRKNIKNNTRKRRG